MTLRCNRSSSSSRRWCVLFTSVLVGLSAMQFADAQQEDGARLPAPPRIKKHSQDDNIPDPDFKSPMKRDNQLGAQGAGSNQEQNRPGLEFRRRMRRRLEEQMNGEQTMDNDTMGSQSGTSGSGRNGPLQGEIGVGQRMRGLGPQGQSSEGQGAFIPGRLPPRARAQRMTGAFMGGRQQLDLTKLNLSDDQKQRIRDIRKNTREKAKDIHQQLQEKQIAVRQMFFSADSNDTQIRQARRELRSLQNKLDDLNLEDMLKVRSVLTADQRQKLPDIAPGAGIDGPKGNAGDASKTSNGEALKNGSGNSAKGAALQEASKQ